MRARSGFTLIEMIVFTAIFTVAMAALVAVLMNVARVQVLQSGMAEVNSQSQFLLQTVQYYVERSSLVDIPAATATTTLKLRMASSSEDPVILSLNGGRMRLQIGGGAAQDITSARVAVSDLAFTKRSNEGGKDTVAVAFTVSSASANPNQRFSHAVRTGVARVSAATFDFDVVPASGNAYELGTSVGDWRSINDTIYFNGSRVGIGVNPVTSTLTVSGGDTYMYTSGTGIIFKNGTNCHRLYLTAGGGIATTSITCP